jgi:hypothetical protein
MYSSATRRPAIGASSKMRTLPELRRSVNALLLFASGQSPRSRRWPRPRVLKTADAFRAARDAMVIRTALRQWLAT